jgi:hypothetical protein
MSNHVVVANLDQHFFAIALDQHAVAAIKSVTVVGRSVERDKHVAAFDGAGNADAMDILVEALESERRILDGFVGGYSMAKANRDTSHQKVGEFHHAQPPIVAS